MHLINPQQIVSITITKITSYQNEVTSGESSEIMNRKYKYNSTLRLYMMEALHLGVIRAVHASILEALEAPSAHCGGNRNQMAG